MSLLRRLFGIPETTKVQSQGIFSEPHAKKVEPPGTSFVDATFVSIPTLEKVAEESYRKPEAYWRLFNKADTDYKKHRYESARKRFLELEDISELHKTASTTRIRNYRKLTTPEKLKKALPADALHLFDEMFEKCSEMVTDTDRKRFNKFLDSNSDEPILDEIKRMVLKPKQIEHYSIRSSSGWVAKYVGSFRSVGQDIRGRGDWHFVRSTNNGVLLGRKHYDRDAERFTHTDFIWTDESGTELSRWNTSGETRLVAASAGGTVVAAITDNLVLRICAPDGSSMEEFQVPVGHRPAYEISCVSISPNGRFITIGIADQALEFEQGVGFLDPFRIPLKEGWIVESVEDEPSAEFSDDLAVLAVTAPVTRAELRSAYREQLKVLHPDLNPEIPDANERTRRLVEAYERLSDENAIDALSTEPGYERYVQLIRRYSTTVKVGGQEISFEISMSIGGDGRDWVSTAYTEDDGRRFIGSRDGHIFRVSKDGTVNWRTHTGQSLNEIRWVNGKLLGATTDNIVSIGESEFYGSALLDDYYSGTIANDCFVTVTRDTMKLFNSHCVLGPVIKFGKNISAVAWVGSYLIVETGIDSHSFTVSAPRV